MGETIKNHPIRIAVGTIVIILSFTASATFFVANSKAKMDERVNSIIWEQAGILEDQKAQKLEFKELEDKHGEEVSNLMARCASNDVLFAGIKEKLLSIESLLMDIKSRQ